MSGYIHKLATITCILSIFSTFSLVYGSNELTIHVANQNSILESTSSVIREDILLDTFVLSGWGVKAGFNQSIRSFLDASDDDIEKAIDKYLMLNSNIIPALFSGYLMLDIEYPVHPKNLGWLDESIRKLYLHSINRRVRIIREYFPKAKIGLYGLFVPHGSCGIHDTDKSRILSLEHGVQNGILNDIDFFTVVVYLRWGGDKYYINKCIAEKVSLVAPIVEGAGIEYFPMLSFRVYNSNSINDQQFVNYNDSNDSLLASLLEQIKELASLGFNELMFWHPRSSVKPESDDNWNQIQLINKLLDQYYGHNADDVDSIFGY